MRMPSRNPTVRSFRRPGLTVAGAALLLAALGCDDATSGSGNVARLDATPPALALVVDESRTISARALDASGTPLARSLFWSVSDASVLSVSQAGTVTAIAPGSAQVAASSNGRSVVVPVTVTARPVALVRVTPGTSTVRVGQSTTLQVQLLDASGGPLSGRPVTWTTSAAAVATVGATGTVAGVSAGAATITAASGGVSGTAVVTVQPIPVASVSVTPATLALRQGATSTLTALTRDSAGRTLTGRVVAWSTSAPTVATVSSTGAVVGLAPGTATITATSEGRSATSAVTVSLVPVATVTVSPATETIVVGQTAPLVARVADSTGAVLNGRTVTWASDRTSVATVIAATGVVTAVAPGTARITASSGGRSGSAVVTVPVIPVASIAITPASATLLPGETLRLTARTLDAQGRTLTGRAVAWIGGAPAVATIDTAGVVTAIAPGTAVMVASSEGARASVPMTVVPVTVHRVTITPAAQSVEAGASLQLTAAITDRLGRPVASTVATWVSSNPALATISASGRVTGVAPGRVTISATSDGITGTTTVTVIPIRVATVTVSPGTIALHPTRTAQLTVQLADSVGRPLSLTGRTITWASASPPLATVSGAGVVSALAPGTVAITATSEGKVGTAQVTVNPIPVASLTVSPATAQVSAGSSVQLTATPHDSLGTAISGRRAVWSSAQPAVATVDSLGVVRAVAPGSVVIRAGIDGVQAAATVGVSMIPVASVSVAPAALTLGVGEALPLAVTLFGGAPGVQLAPAGYTIVWSIVGSGVAFISSSGVVTGSGPGTATVTVRAWAPGQMNPATASVIVTVR